MTRPIDKIDAALDAAGWPRRRLGSRITASCLAPGHGAGRGDRRPSLQIKEASDGTVLISCFAGCTAASVAAALGLTMRDLFPRAGNQAHRGAPRRLVASPLRPPRIDPTWMAHLASEYGASLTCAALAHLAHQLGITTQALRQLEVGWDRQWRAWTFPMRDGDGALTGFRLRRVDGSKFTVKGTHEGLFLPAGMVVEKSLLVAEGPTDTAALLDLGLPTIGRPSCAGGVDQVVTLVRRLAVTEVVIVADRDEPGQRGAGRLADAVVRFAAVRIITPPAKDVRDWIVQDCATASQLQRLVADAPVQRLRVAVYRVRAGGRP